MNTEYKPGMVAELCAQIARRRAGEFRAEAQRFLQSAASEERRASTAPGELSGLADAHREVAGAMRYAATALLHVAGARECEARAWEGRGPVGPALDVARALREVMGAQVGAVAVPATWSGERPADAAGGEGADR